MRQFNLSDRTLRQGGQHFRVCIWQVLGCNLHLTAGCPDWENFIIIYISVIKSLGQSFKLGQHRFRVRCLQFITCNYVTISRNITNTVQMRRYFSYLCSTFLHSVGWIAKIGIEIRKVTN
jgi:hypothetical protein